VARTALGTRATSFPTLTLSPQGQSTHPVPSILPEWSASSTTGTSRVQELQPDSSCPARGQLLPWEVHPVVYLESFLLHG
jgi:hypothetical protein